MVRGEKDLDPANPFICSYFDMQELGKEMGFDSQDKVHIVGYEPILTKGNEKLLHHFVLYSCEGTANMQGGLDGIDDSRLVHQQVIPACTSMPPGCSQYLAAWAVGAPAQVMPEQVGIPIGEGRRWLVLQTHYYNPTLENGVYDSSGFRVDVTKDVRPIDAGVMQFNVGTITGQHPPLPGGRSDTAMETLYVEPECTEQWTEPLTVLYVGHHSHFMGLHQEITVHREGKNLGPMRKEFRFDYNHQSGVPPVKALETILPGDRITASCHFDTSVISSDSQVEIGEESNREMCFPTFIYYPKQDLNTFTYYDRELISGTYINDTKWCSLPSMDDTFASMCEEKMYTDFPGFYSMLFEFWSYDGPSFDYPAVCNGGDLTKDLRVGLPPTLWLTDYEVCPEGCVETQSCSEEELLEHAKLMCQANCGVHGLSLYPDLNKTEAYNAVNLGCPQAMFHAPTLAEPEECQARGTLPQVISLIDFEKTEEDAAETKQPIIEGDKDNGEPANEEDKNSGGTVASFTSFAALFAFRVLLVF